MNKQTPLANKKNKNKENKKQKHHHHITPAKKGGR